MSHADLSGAELLGLSPVVPVVVTTKQTRPSPWPAHCSPAASA